MSRIDAIFTLFKHLEKIEDGTSIFCVKCPIAGTRWLAQGNGECLGSQDDADTAWNYPMESSNAPLREGAKVRKWEDTEWHEPTVDYMGLEEK